MAAAFDVQLGERLLQRGLDRRDFFRRVIFLHRSLALARPLFSAAAASIFSGFERHVGQHRNGIRFDLDKTFADRHRGFASILEHAQFARFQSRQQRNVFRVNAELAFRSRAT